MNNPYFELIAHAWRCLLFSLFLCFHQYDFEKNKKENNKADWNWRFLCIKYDRFLTDFPMQTKFFFYLLRLYRFDADEYFFVAIFAWASISTKSSWGCFQGVPYYIPSFYVLNYFSLNYYLHLDIGMILVFHSYPLFCAQYEIEFRSVNSHALCTIGKKIQNSSFTCKNSF